MVLFLWVPNFFEGNLSFLGTQGPLRGVGIPVPGPAVRLRLVREVLAGGETALLRHAHLVPGASAFSSVRFLRLSDV